MILWFNLIFFFVFLGAMLRVNFSSVTDTPFDSERVAVEDE
jgi:hypothetical protein